METKRLQPEARVVLALTVLYTVAEALCAVFVGVYFWINSSDFGPVCAHYMALYALTPVSCILSGWYAKKRDRVHVYRLSLMLHAVYYGALLLLQESSPQYAVPLGVLQGLTWGCYWTGANTLHFDVSEKDKREHFFGWLSLVNGYVRLLVPLLSAGIIRLVPNQNTGYHILFLVAVLMYAGGVVVSFRVPSDKIRRPFRIGRALFPGRDQRDWAWMMAASFTQGGGYGFFYILIGLSMYIQTENELSVGGVTALQGMVTIVAAWAAGRYVRPHTRVMSLRWGTILLWLGGALMFLPLSVYTIALFGLLRAMAQPLFNIPHMGIRMGVIERCAEDSSQRIEYLSAWELPLSIGRIVMIGLLLALTGWVPHLAVRIIFALLCVNRLLTYLCLTRVSFVRNPELAS